MPTRTKVKDIQRISIQDLTERGNPHRLEEDELPNLDFGRLDTGGKYSITELGRTQQVPFGAVCDWAINPLHEIEQAQEAFDKKADR